MIKFWTVLSLDVKIRGPKKGHKIEVKKLEGKKLEPKKLVGKKIVGKKY